MKKLILILFVLMLLTACDCYQRVKGVVTIKDTDTPLQDVKISNKQKTYDYVLSDSMGYFEISNISGGFKCPPITIVVESEEYKTQELTVKHSQTDTLRIELVPLNK